MPVSRPHRVLMRTAGIAVAGTSLALLLKTATGNDQGTQQQRLWRIAQQLHAPGDTTNQTVATSTASTAWTIRAEIAHLLKKGYSGFHIVHIIEGQYGPAVLSDPSTTGFGLTVWIFPLIAFLVILWLALSYLLRRRVRPSTAGQALARGERGATNLCTDSTVSGHDPQTDVEWRQFL